MNINLPFQWSVDYLCLGEEYEYNETSSYQVTLKFGGAPVYDWIISNRLADYLKILPEYRNSWGGWEDDVNENLCKFVGEKFGELFQQADSK